LQIFLGSKQGLNERGNFFGRGQFQLSKPKVQSGLLFFFFMQVA